MASMKSPLGSGRSTGAGLEPTQDGVVPQGFFAPIQFSQARVAHQYPGRSWSS